MLRLGSLFSGSGGFELAGVLQGILPVWASEVEPYPIAVTTSRFPNIQHIGDVNTVDGSKLEPVDIITFGSPCQNLSVAGNQKGLEGEQSSLFYQAIRIIKEMRNATNGIYPRIAVWENVPGAFSSNKGEDFRTVLQEFVNICEPTAVVPKVPKAGWSYYDCWYGDRWSIAYRTFDAQHWGVPQRRKRIYLVADFRGRRAKEILFEQDGLRGYFEKGRTPWQAIATSITRSTRTNDKDKTGRVVAGFDRYNQCSTGEVCETLKTPGGGDNYPVVYIGTPVTFEPGILKREGGHTYDGIAGTVRANAGDNQLAIAYGVDGYNQCVTGEVAKTITSGRNDTHNIPCVMQADVAIGVDCYNQSVTGDKSKSLTASACDTDHIPCVVSHIMVENHPADSRVNIDDSGTCQTLTSRMGTGGGNVPMVMCVHADQNDNFATVKGATYCYNIGDRWGIPNEHVEKSPTLTARCGTGGNNVPELVYCLQDSNSERLADNQESVEQVLSVDMGGGKSACVIREEVSPTLTCTHYGEPAVAYCIGDNKQANSENVCMGNGKQIVGTLYAKQGEKQFLDNQAAFNGDYHVVEKVHSYYVGNGQADQTYLKDKVGALNCMHDQQCVLNVVALDRATFNAGKTQKGFEVSENGVNAPLIASGPSAVAYENKIQYIVRRITPTECARLQGFPDYWGHPNNKEDFTDSELDFWCKVRKTYATINGKQIQNWNKQSMLRWYNSLHTDSAEYKMWGNGVALPTTLYVMQGIADAYKKESDM